MKNKKILDTSIGFIGAGMMGAPMIYNLTKSFSKVYVFDTDQTKLKEFENNKRIIIMDQIGKLSKYCNIIFTCLPGISEVKKVHLDKTGIFENILENVIICELSTTLPRLSMCLEKKYNEKKSTYLEAMMIGPPKTAYNAELLFIISGQKVDNFYFLEALNCMGRLNKWVGSIGNASKAKLLHNALGMINMAATAEILGLCVKSGIDINSFIDIVRQSPKSKGIGYSTIFDLYSESIINKSKTGTGKLRIAAKDTFLAKELASDQNYSTPILDETKKMFEEANQLGLGEEEYSRVADIVEFRYGGKIF